MAPCCLKMAPCCLTLLQLGLNLVQSWLQVGPSWAQVGSKLPQVGQSWPKLASSWPKLASSWPKLAQLGLKLPQVGSKLASSWFKHVQNLRKNIASMLLKQKGRLSNCIRNVLHVAIWATVTCCSSSCVSFHLMVFPRPDNEQLLLWNKYGIAVGFDGSLVNDGDYVYVLGVWESQHPVMQINFVLWIIWFRLGNAMPPIP